MGLNFPVIDKNIKTSFSMNYEKSSPKKVISFQWYSKEQEEKVAKYQDTQNDLESKFKISLDEEYSEKELKSELYKRYNPKPKKKSKLAHQAKKQDNTTFKKYYKNENNQVDGFNNMQSKKQNLKLRMTLKLNIMIMFDTLQNKKLQVSN